MNLSKCFFEQMLLRLLFHLFGWTYNWFLYSFISSCLQVEVGKNQRNRTFQHCSLGSRSNNHRLCTIKLIRATAVEHFGEPTKFTDHRNNLAQHVWNATVKRVKYFPWNEAKNLALIRFLHLAKNAAKWSFIAIFIFGPASDVYLSIARNKELMIPIGLFIGVILADIIKESSVEFFQQNLKVNSVLYFAVIHLIAFKQLIFKSSCFWTG